jgi:hypothetical protein
MTSNSLTGSSPGHRWDAADARAMIHTSEGKYPSRSKLAFWSAVNFAVRKQLSALRLIGYAHGFQVRPNSTLPKVRK